MANEKPCFVDQVKMAAKHDLFHGGASKRYQIIYWKDHYRITLTTSRLFPRPGERNFKASKKIIHITKSSEEISQLFKSLIEEFHIFKLTNLETKIVLHPTIYEFTISNSCGETNKFSYVIESDHHIDEIYERLVGKIIRFFEN